MSFSSGFPLQAPPSSSLPERHTASQVTRASFVVAQRSYAQEQQLVLSPKRRDSYKAIRDVMLVRDRLGPEEQSRFDSQYLRAQEKAKAIAERHEDIFMRTSLISRSVCQMPDAVPKKTWRKKKEHGKPNAQGLTAAEASDKDRNECERLAKIASKARATSEDVAEEGDSEISRIDTGQSIAVDARISLSP